MAEALGFMLPSALAAIAFSLPAIVVMILLLEPGANRGNAVGLSLGWIASFLIVCGLFVFAADAISSETTDDQSTWVTWLLVILGTALLAVGLRKIRNRPHPDHPAKPSAIMKAVEKLTPAKALLLGGLMGGFNPKFLAVIGSLAAELTLTDTSRTQDAIIMVLFTVIASTGVLGPLIVIKIAGNRAQPSLDRISKALQEWTWLIMAVIFIYFGVKLIGDALRTLT